MDDLLRDPVRRQHNRPAQDLTRFGFLALLGASLAALAGAGCGGGEENGSAIGPAGVPGAAGTLSWALDERPANLDPLYADAPGEQLVARQIYEPLVAKLAAPFDDAGRISGLALSALPSADRTVWRLRLRPGVRFQDGAPFNATAVLRNVERWQRSAVGLALLGELLADAPRPDLVRFILPAPDPRFAARLTSPRLGIVSPRALAQSAGGELDPDRAAAGGTGPFELRERSADRLLLARNTDWWGTERGLGPAIDQLEFTVVPEPSERLGSLADGSVQVAGRLRPAELRAVRDDPLLTVVDEPGPHGLGIERSVRGIPADDPAPALNGVWRTGIEAG